MSNVGEILISEFTNMELMFDSNRKGAKEETMELYKTLFRKLEILELKTGIYYRARKIDKKKDVLEEKNIKLASDGRVYGFNKKNSGVPPIEKCIAGRLNRKYEQVLYLSDDEITCFYEVKPELNEYISLAKFNIIKPIKILDFTPYCKEDYIDFFDKKALFEFQQKGYNLQQLFFGIQRILVIPDFAANDYKIANEIANMIKDVSKEIKVDGIKYKSFYTKGNNIALWNYDNVIFASNRGEVYNYYKNDPLYEAVFISLNTSNIISKKVMFDTLKKDIIKENIKQELIDNLFDISIGKDKF